MKVLAGFLVIVSTIILFVDISYRNDAREAWKIVREEAQPTHEAVISGEALNQIWFHDTWQFMNSHMKYRVQVSKYGKILRITDVVKK